MSSKKGIYPCIWLLKGKAVKGFDNNEIVSEDPAELIRSYVESGADGVIIFDRSKGDAEHDAAIDFIRGICEKCTVPVIAAGNVRRMEDVKKLIYAGCQMAALNLSKESNRVLAREVCERFGRERIAGCYKSTENLEKEWKKLAPWLSMRILLDAENPAAVKEAASGDDSDSAMESIPEIALMQDPSPEALSSRLSIDSVSAVSGDGVNRLVTEGSDTVQKIRDSFKESGIDMEEHGKRLSPGKTLKKVRTDSCLSSFRKMPPMKYSWSLT